MKTYWAFIKTGVGSYIKVTVQAPNPYAAHEMMKALYGKQLLSIPALQT